MNAQARQQLAALDRSLLSLLNERARLVCEIVGSAAEGGSGEAASAAWHAEQHGTDDLLRRNRGPLDALAIEDILAAVDRACRAAARGARR